MMLTNEDDENYVPPPPAEPDPSGEPAIPVVQDPPPDPINHNRNYIVSLVKKYDYSDTQELLNSVQFVIKLFGYMRTISQYQVIN